MPPLSKTRMIRFPHTRKLMTTRPPRSTHADPDTFEARWDRSVERGIKHDETQHERAIGTLVVIASAAAIAAAWFFTTQ
jgi:hypothetical protein